MAAFAQIEPEESRPGNATDCTGLTGHRGEKGVALLLLDHTNIACLPTLLRHDWLAGGPQPVPGLALRMELAATWGRLITPVRGPVGLDTGRPCTDRTAVPVAAVATLADDHLLVALVAGKEPLGVANFTTASRARHNTALYRSAPMPQLACGKRPLFPRTPISPAGGLPGYGRLPPPPAPPGTLPHPLENATRFPQPTGPYGGERRREDGCTVLIVAAAQE